MEAVRPEAGGADPWAISSGVLRVQALGSMEKATNRNILSLPDWAVLIGNKPQEMRTLFIFLP
jgi:hypothetical protein